MKYILICLIASVIVAGCTGVTMQLVAFAFPEPTPSVLSAVPLVSLTTEISPPVAVPTAVPVITATAEPKPSTTAAPFNYAYGPYYFPLEINPLTGLPIVDSQLLDRRPIVIKVTNFPRSVRPQWGLSLADHVFEYYIGDSMSRFIGVFYGRDASQVGPIRSARLFDEHVMRMYNSIFIFGWADDPVLEFLFAPDIKSHLVVERPDNCPPLCRIGPEGAYNNLYADTTQIGPYLDDRGTNNDRQKLNGLRFELEVPKSGNPGNLFYLDYSVVSYHYWKYDLNSGRYLRYQETDDASGNTEKQYAPLTDSLTGSQLAADNVVVLLVPHQFFLRSSSTEILDQPLEGSGSGYAFRNGFVYPITWTHDAPDQLIKMTLPNGVPYPLKPGTVWYEVIGETSEFGLLDEGMYQFTFDIP